MRIDHTLGRMEPLKNVAFADDEPGILRALEMACGTHYKIVGQATNGLEAISLAKSFQPQVLILDVHMPVLDGFEVIRQIAPLKTTAVVVLTADTDAGIAQKAMDLGAAGYLAKPFEFSQVIPMIESAWHHFQSMSSLQKEVLTLSENLETRKLVEKAKGILMEQQGMTEEMAHRTLQKLSQDQAISLKEVCRSLIQVRTVLGKTVQQRKVV